MSDINHFTELSKINVNDKTEEKNGLTYLSWAWAWDTFKRSCPDATYRIIKTPEGLPYFETRAGAMVYTEVTVEGVTHEMWLPVMDGANRAMKSESYKYTVWNKFEKRHDEKTVEAYSMFDVNKTLMRCLVKNLAMFGLGIYIYAGEDLPLEDDATVPESPQKEARPKNEAKAPKGWRNLPWHLPFGKAKKGNYAYKGQTLGEINANDPEGLAYWIKTFEPTPYKGKINEKDQTLRLAMDVAREELGNASDSAQERSKQDNEEQVSQTPKLGRQELLTALTGLSAENEVSFEFILGLLKKKSVILAEVVNIEGCTTEVLQQVHDNFKWFISQKAKQEVK